MICESFNRVHENIEKIDVCVYNNFLILLEVL